MVISIAVYFTRILIQQNEITVLKQEKIIQQKKEREYLRLMEEGDHWLTKSHWHNARFDYKKAQEIFPNDYAVNYRILKAYILECENDCNNCNKAKNVLGKMIAAFTEKKLELMPLIEKLKTVQECLSLKG
ncbi:hypothetical protein [Mesonia aquimarina]|uniref:hypothetical protein n=1 Tax=Mesonia aquimarina TaxID=1504967 RepID=UPI000EF5ADF8|nr:hypothetical protein [Mesonia aquimarina]